MDTVRVLSSCGTAAFGGTSVDVADLLDISLILEAPDDEHQTQEPLSAVLPPPLRSISPDVDKEIPSSKTWMDSDSTGSTKSRNGLLHNSKQWDSSSQSVAAPAAEGPQLTSSHQAVASFARSLIDSSAPDEEPDHYSDRAFNMEQILDPDHSSALRASLLSLVSDMLHNQPTNITPSTSQSPKELTQSAPTPDPIVVSQGDVLQIAIPDGHLVGRAKPVTQPSKTSEKAGKMDIIMNGGLSSSSTSSNLAVTRQKSADYPDNIDHIEFDTVSNGSLPSARSNTEFASRQSRLFTIRNMNPSSKQAFSAMMSKLGEKHNMQYNEEKLCWESQDPDPPLALLDSELEGHMEHKPQIDHVIAEQPSARPISLETPGFQHSYQSDVSGLTCLKEIDAAMEELAGIDLSQVTEGDARSEGRSTSSNLASCNFQSPLDSQRPNQSEPLSRFSSQSLTYSQLQNSKQYFDNVQQSLPESQPLIHVEELEMDRQELFDLSSISKTYPELKILSIRNNCLSHLHGLPKGLVVLIAEGNRLSSLTSFRSTPNIRFLDISSNFITDLSALSHLHFLQELNVSRNQVTCIGPIRHLSKLSILNLSGNAIRRVEFAQREFEVLSVLDLRHNQIEILDGLHHLPAIQRVFADNNVLASLNLQGPISLEQLSLKCNNLSERSFHITNQVIISDLNLSENCFESLRVLPSSIMVQRLCISQQRNQSILLNSSIALWKMLTELDISGTIIESLDPFQAAENLKVLLARRCHLTSFSEALASSLQKLRTLCLGSNKITHLDPLVFLARLEYLDMSDNCLHTFRTTLSTVRKLKHLQFLDFRGNPITAKFYPPVSTTTRTQLKEQLFHSFSPMSCNNPKDVAADATLDWSQKDKEFCERAPDAWFIKRVCYRSILITSLHRLLKLDGVKILPEEQSSASYILKKMKKSVSQN